MPNIVRLIEYFNCNIITENTFDKDKWIKLNEKAMKVGYWIHPNAANQYTKAFLKTKIVDYNSTFYKTRYKEDISFNAETGELQVNGKTNLPFNKEYWMPENESGTPQIETLVDSGPSINDSEQLKYFLSKLYKMSKIPENRFDKEAQSTWFGSDATQQLRDEINFSRFVTRKYLVWIRCYPTIKR